MMMIVRKMKLRVILIEVPTTPFNEQHTGSVTLMIVIVTMMMAASLMIMMSQR